MSTVLVTPYQVLSKRIRFNYLPVCLALILAGALLWASTYRQTVLTCQRQQDTCTLTRLRWLAGPTHSFSPKDIISVRTDACCNSDSATYQLILTTRQGALDLFQTRPSKPEALDPAAGLIDQFIHDASILELNVRLDDPRLENMGLGIFLLAMGLFYLVAMAQVQLQVRDTLTGKLSIQNRTTFAQATKGPLPLKSDESQETSSKEMKGLGMQSWRAWLSWVLLSMVGPLLSMGVGHLIFILNLQPPFWSFITQLFYYLAIVTMVIGAQVWVIQRSIGEGRRWLAYTGIGLVFLAASIILVFYEQPNTLFPFMMLSPGLFQWWALRRQLPHASWWIIASSLGQWLFFSAADTAIKLMTAAGFYQSQPTSVTSAIYDASRWLGWLAYLVITGAMLVYLIHGKNKLVQPNLTLRPE